MGAVSVARMRVTAPPGQIGHCRQRGEDALRLAGSERSRLLLIRRLALPPMPYRASATLWQARAAERLSEAASRAVHGGQSGAETAGAVWFHSPEEARGLLLLLLARGLRPRAWYWRLAVPDWREQPPGRWFNNLVRETAARPVELAALSRNVLLLIETGLSPIVMQWIACEAGSSAVASMLDESQSTATDLVCVNRISRRLRPDVLDKVRTVLTDDAAPPSSRAALARLVLIAAAPELASTPAETARLATLWIGSTHAADRPAPAEAEASGRAAPFERKAPAPADARQGPLGADIILPIDDSVAIAPSLHAAADAPPPGSTAEIESSPLTRSEARSAIAGLFLLVRPLWRMGLGDWLAARPDLLAEGFGRCLLAAIGSRMRADMTDPIFSHLGSEPPPPEWKDALTAWRVGLDRWLRRSARIRLADVVNRCGWLSAGHDRLDLRFEVNQADLRLRRQALDLDPGWVDWLGLVVRYHYRDMP